jgi:predicted RNase H-like HicB family nuclease
MKATKGAKAKSGKASRDRLDRPFATEIWRQAKAIAGEYQIVVECEEAHWYGRGLELPHVFGDGATPEKCIAQTREALAVAAAYLLEQGQQPPTPARMGHRTQQVNVRLTAEEKAILEGTARRKGFEGLSDFIRAAALESAR